MKKLNKAIFSVIFISLGIPSITTAQDIIYLTDNSSLKAVVESVSDNKVEFRYYGETDLSIYSVSTNDIKRIEYENGDVKQFADKVRIKRVDEAQTDLNGTLLKYRMGRFSLVNDRGMVVDSKLKHRELKELLLGHEVYPFYKQHRAFKTGKWIMGGVALTFLAGYLAMSLDGFTEEAMPLMYGAWGFIIIGELPCAILEGVYGRKTARTYNEYSSNEPRLSLGIGATPNGIGLVMKF